jgi:hypothetical protein
MLRANVVRQILTTLEKNPKFRAEDFSVDQSATGETLTLIITYRYEDSYAFRAMIPLTDKQQFVIAANMSPGNLLAEETGAYGSTASLLTGIKNWVIRIDQELQAVPANRELAAQQQAIEDLVETIAGLSDEYFTREEADDLLRRLDELEAQLAQNVRERVTNKKERDSKIERIHADVESLKEKVVVLKKSGWLKAAGVKTLGWLKDPTNRALLKSGAEVTKSLLLGSGDKHP